MAMMMTNLFSIFDPSVSLFRLDYFVFFVFFLLLYFPSWLAGKNFNFLFMKSLYGELVSSSRLGSSSLLFFVCLFLGLFYFNFLSLFPFLFTLTAHPSISFSFALSCWLGINLYGWMSFFSGMMEHLVPVGTPLALMNFMVLIELVSNLIRPITLSVRLTANMSAGHLLLSLLGGVVSLGLGVSISMGVLGLLLVILECGVSFIQGYVFMVLFSLYCSEVG